MNKTAASAAQSAKCILLHTYYSSTTMGVGTGGQGGRAPWIFKHGTNIVDRG